MNGDTAPREGRPSSLGERIMPQSERHALVIGGGTMGVGIIAMFLGGGWTVDVVSRSASTRDGLATATAKALAAMGKPTDTKGLKTFATLPDADWKRISLAVETVTEDLALKQKLFAEMEALSTAGAANTCPPPDRANSAA